MCKFTSSSLFQFFFSSNNYSPIKERKRKENIHSFACTLFAVLWNRVLFESSDNLPKIKTAAHQCDGTELQKDALVKTSDPYTAISLTALQT